MLEESPNRIEQELGQTTVARLHRHGIRAGTAVGKDRRVLLRDRTRAIIFEAQLSIESNPAEGFPSYPLENILRKPFLSIFVQ